MKSDAWLTVAGAHSQVIGVNGANLRDQQMWTHLIAQPLDRKDRLDCVAPGQEVFRLKFLPSARGKAHAEVRQPVVPWPGYAHLFRAILGGKLGDWMQVSGSKLGPEEFPGRFESRPAADAALDPDLVDTLLLPIGKQTDAVTARLNFVEVTLHLSEREVLIHVLPHHIGGLNVESDPGDDTECAKSDYRCLEDVAA